MNTVYLACAIDQANGTDELKDLTMMALLKLGFTVFDPQRAFLIDMHKLQPGQADFVFEVNMAAMMTADLRIFIIDRTPSWGVPMELFSTVVHNEQSDLPFILVDVTGLDYTPVYLHMLLESANCRLIEGPETSQVPIVRELQEQYGRNNAARFWVSGWKNE